MTKQKKQKTNWVICDHSGMKKCIDQKCDHKKKHKDIGCNNDDISLCIDKNKKKVLYMRVKCVPWKPKKK